MGKWILTTSIALLTGACWTIAEQAERARPAVPQVSRVSSINGTNVLYWNTVDGAARYKVYRNGQFLATVMTEAFWDDDPQGAISYYVIASDATDRHVSAKSNVVTTDAAHEFQTAL